ncbi:MAG: HAD-IA family hydrolase [Chloroflexota bacterium]|nr:HAD-IA family hydrolase [Chloroflexota bacterium]
MNIMLNLNKKKYFFFDIYGTLAGFYPQKEKIQKKILEQNKIFLSETKISYGYKFADEFMALKKKIKPLRNMSTSEKKDFFSEYENKILSSNNIQVSKDLSWKIWQEISLEKYSLRIFDDTKDLLEWLLSKGIKSAGITNMDIKGDQLMLDLNLTSLLDFIITSYDEKYEKPDKRIFISSINKANVNPEECVYVGDQIESDYIGSKNAGMTPILIDRDDYYEDFSGNKIKSLGELKLFFN